jgi:hypothetical protein
LTLSIKNAIIKLIISTIKQLTKDKPFINEVSMSDIHSCPTCNARARQVRDADSGEFRLKAIQDDEAAAKIAQLKQLLEKEKSRNEQLKAKLAQHN